ncbi:hypothetical protein HDE_02152 [Halotydeus destructor]|nr:hypothetical protein HDE_02152 [Halotydeus destructor]
MSSDNPLKAQVAEQGQDVEANNGSTPTEGAKEGLVAEETVALNMAAADSKIYNETTTTTVLEETNSAFLDFFTKLGVPLLGTTVVGCCLGLTLLVGFILLLPLIMVIVGATHYDECALANLPLLLIVGGVLGLVHSLAQSVWRAPKGQEVTRAGQIVISIINIVHFIWFIYAVKLIFWGDDPDFEDEFSPVYCTKLVYKFSYWYVLIGVILSAFSLCCTWCALCTAGLAAIGKDAK